MKELIVCAMAELLDFVHEKIDLERSAFRLLQVLRGDQPTIECILYQAYLSGSDTIPYDALSYTWGNQGKTASVLVNGKAMKITPNLHSAFQHFRSPKVDKVLWIDAICIDQDDERERGHQVQQMCRIYSQAEETLVWLGQSTHETDLLMETLRRLEQYSSVHEYRTWELKQWNIFWELIPRDPLWQLIKGLKTLLERPWFKRIWVLQEIARSTKASIWCGSKSVQAHIFAIAPSLIGIEPERHCQAVLDIMPGHLRDNSWWSESRDLYNLLTKFRESEASDPRDKVYALLGISSDAQDTDGLRPDYTKSVQQVIQDTSSFLFGPSKLSYETMSNFLFHLSSRHAAAFVDLVRTSDLSGAEHFLKQRGLETALPEGTMEAITENKNSGSDIMKFILRTRGNEVKITERMIRAVVENMECGADFLGLLLQTCKRSTDEEEIMKALQSASARGNEAMVKLLLDNSAPYHPRILNGKPQDECYKHVLYSASASGQNDIIKNIVQGSSGTRYNDPQDGVYNAARYDLALALASANGYDQTVGLLLDLGANVNMQRQYFRGVRKDRVASKYTAAKMLVDKGAEINSHGMVYVNPLHLASTNGHEQVVKLLLERGADVNAHKSMHGPGRHTTALEAASASGREEVVKLLVQNGAL